MELAQKAGAKIVDPLHDTFGEGIPVTLWTPMGICGKSHGIRNGSSRIKGVYSELCYLVSLKPYSQNTVYLCFYTNL